MLKKYRHTELFVANDEEFSKIADFEDIFALIEFYGVYAGHGEFPIVYALSRLFFKDERHIPQKINKQIKGITGSFVFDQEFIERVASFARDEMDSLAYILREDDYIQANNLDSMGLWVFLYQLHDCCKLVVEKNINLYLVEEEIEPVLE